MVLAIHDGMKNTQPHHGILALKSGYHEGMWRFNALCFLHLEDDNWGGGGYFYVSIGNERVWHQGILESII